jgi:hypothetical protein
MLNRPPSVISQGAPSPIVSQERDGPSTVAIAIDQEV